MNWYTLLKLYKFSDAESIKPSLIQWATRATNLPQPTIQQIVDQVIQEERNLLEKGFFNTREDKRYSNSLWAKNRFKELLGIQKQKEKTKEDPSIRKAKGINQKYWEWVLFNLNQGILDFDRSIFDYFNAKNINPSNLSYREAKEQSDKWHEEKYHTKEKATYKTPVTAGEKIGDMYMVEVTEEDEKAEGINMQNCIGDKCNVSDRIRIFSLRDSNNNPHANIEVVSNSIRQIRGKQNKTLREPEFSKYVPYVKEWIHNHKEFRIGTLDNLPLERDDLLTLHKNKRLSLNSTMIFSASEGYIDIVKLMLEKGANDYNEAMVKAAYGGYIDIVKLMLDKGAKVYNFSMYGAAFNGHIDIVKLMSERGADMYNRSMGSAALNGHMDIVKLMLERGAVDYDWSMESAASGGHMDIVKLMLKRGAGEYNLAMEAAALNGHIDIVRLMLEKGSDNYDRSISEAAFNGHTDIVKLISEWKRKKNASNINWYKMAKSNISEKELNSNLKKIIKNNPFFKLLFDKFHVPLDRIDDHLTFKIEDLHGKNAYSDSEKAIFNKKLFTNGDFFTEGLHYVVHELVHWLQRQRENTMYFSDPEEIEAFSYGIAYELNRNCPVKKIVSLYYPIIKKHFPEETDAKMFFKHLFNDAKIKSKEFNN